MQAGQMDRRVVIESAGSTLDTFGESIETWSTFATVWASVRVNGGRESFDSDQVIAEGTTTFKIRYLSGMSERMRIVYNSANYDIQSIKELGRKEGLEILATVNNAA